jgi:hypothetical protein
MKILIASLILAASFFAQAQTRIVSVDAFDLSYTGGLLFKTDKGVGRVENRDETTFRVNLNYAQSLDQYVGLMWKAKVYVNREDVDDTLYSAYGAAGGALYNLQADDVKNSIFFGGLLGVERASIDNGDKDKSGFNVYFDIEGGKRWDMGSYAKVNLSYAPSINFKGIRYGGGIREDFYKTGTELRFNFLKFDILF